MDKPKLLDLFCGAGGCSMGYHRAGFDVTGVDINPQPRYPFTFIQADVMTLDPEFIRSFDAVHASPPCQAYSVSWNLRKREHPRLIEPVRDMLIASGRPYIIENVIGAPFISPFMLCGTSFGLGVEVRGVWYELRRHRLFESNIAILTPQCNHQHPVIGIYGHGESKPMRDKRGFQISHADIRRKVMGMPWANRDEIAQAIPPAYTEFIGNQLREYLRSKS